MLRFVVAIITVMFFFGVSSVFAATKVSGKISWTQAFREGVKKNEDASSMAKLRGYWNEHNGRQNVELPFIYPETDLGVVIFKDGAPAPAPDKVSSVNVLTGGLEKNVIVIRPGTRLKFIMKDPFDHELYSPDMSDFEPQRLAQRGFRPVDFTKEGIYEIRCKLMPHFQGWVVVTSATFVANVKSNGTFSFDNLKHGNYKIKVFHKGKWISEQSFKIKEKEKEVAVEIKLDDSKSAKNKNSSKGKDSNKTNLNVKGDNEKASGNLKKK